MFILDSVAQYSPKDDREAQRWGWGGGGNRCTVGGALSLMSPTALTVTLVISVIVSLTCHLCHLCHCSVGERVMPRLSHANAAVVLSAVKVLMKMTEHVPQDSPFLDTLNKKLAPPLGEGEGQEREREGQGQKREGGRGGGGGM